ncbi:MAG: hypothetical protein AB2421_15540 [Thermotaleaceae bacterium]
MRKKTDFLTIEEKAIYFELKEKMYRAQLLGNITDKEYSFLYQKASKVLLEAIDRELAKRGLAYGQRTS